MTSPSPAPSPNQLFPCLLSLTALNPLPLTPSALPQDAQWPSDPEKSALAFVYTTSQIISNAVPRPPSACPLSEKRLKVPHAPPSPFLSNALPLKSPLALCSPLAPPPLPL